MAALTCRVFLQGEGDRRNVPVLCVSCSQRAMRVATVRTDWERMGRKDELWAFDPRWGFWTAQEGALWSGTVQSFQHAHIHHPGSLCEYNVSNSATWISTGSLYSQINTHVPRSQFNKRSVETLCFKFYSENNSLKRDFKVTGEQYDWHKENDSRWNSVVIRKSKPVIEMCCI